MAKTTKPAEHLADSALEILVWPAKVKLRCDHAGVELHDEQEPDIHEEPTRPDAVALVRNRYMKRCALFGKTTAVALTHVDDPLRTCPSCGFNRTIVGVA